MYTQLICLANSWKRGERCVAGIEPSTGKFIRPVTDSKEGKIPIYVSYLETGEPALLDILEIPLAETGPDFGYASENRLILQGKWRYLGKVKPTDLIKYCDKSPFVLHNDKKYVSVSYLQTRAFEQRHTLQLVYALQFTVECKERARGGNVWKGTIYTKNGQLLSDLNITDPVFCERLEAGYRPLKPCLVTISLSMPWRPPDWEHAENPCWKLIAGVIEMVEEKSDVKPQEPITSWNCVRTLQGKSPIAIARDEKYLIARSNDDDLSVMKFWDFEQGKLIKTQIIQADYFRPSAISADGNILANIGDDNTIQLWDLQSGKLMRTFADNSDCVYLESASFSLDGKYIASSSSSGGSDAGDTSIKVWWQDYGKHLAYTLSQGEIGYYAVDYKSLTFSADGKIIGSIIDLHPEKSIMLWDMATGTISGNFGHSENLNCFAFSANNLFIASGNEDGKINIWNLITQNLILNIAAHSYGVNCVAFSNDSQIVAAGSKDKTIKLWDVKTGNLISSLEGHLDAIDCILFHQDDKNLISSSKDGAIKIWQLVAPKQNNYISQELNLIPF